MKLVSTNVINVNRCTTAMFIGIVVQSESLLLQNRTDCAMRGHVRLIYLLLFRSYLLTSSEYILLDQGAQI